jgi:hypothetical protein
MRTCKRGHAMTASNKRRNGECRRCRKMRDAVPKVDDPRSTNEMLGMAPNER